MTFLDDNLNLWEAFWLFAPIRQNIVGRLTRSGQARWPRVELQNIARSFVFLSSEIVDWEEDGCITKEQGACNAVWESDSLTSQNQERSIY